MVPIQVLNRRAAGGNVDVIVHYQVSGTTVTRVYMCTCVHVLLWLLFLLQGGSFERESHPSASIIATSSQDVTVSDRESLADAQKVRCMYSPHLFVGVVVFVVVLSVCMCVCCNCGYSDCVVVACTQMEFPRAMKRLHLSVRRMTGDGACLFRAVSYLLLDKEDYHFGIRSACCDHMVNFCVSSTV